MTLKPDSMEARVLDALKRAPMRGCCVAAAVGLPPGRSTVSTDERVRPALYALLKAGLVSHDYSTGLYRVVPEEAAHD